MGRGRQKAKNMKVARKLKYFSPDTDFSSLQRELSGNEGSAGMPTDPSEEEDEYWEDNVPSSGWGYSDWDDDDDDEDED